MQKTLAFNEIHSKAVSRFGITIKPRRHVTPWSLMKSWSSGNIGVAQYANELRLSYVFSIHSRRFQDLALKLQQEGQYYADTIVPLSSIHIVTLFLPSDQAMAKIPASKLAALSGQTLSDVSFISSLATNYYMLISTKKLFS